MLCDDADGLAARAAAILARNGYADLRILDGGIKAWAAAGFELFSGVNVPSKAFGEYIEHANGTPSIAAGELEALIRGGADMVVLDSRPFDEYVRVSIPTATNVPGAELVLRARDIAPSPDTLVVVNCAGRTRSIIGAQSLINAGVRNKVVALRNGTMGWSLAGFPCDSGKNRRAPGVSPPMLDWARQAAPVSYTHLDVYKRQRQKRAGLSQPATDRRQPIRPWSQRSRGLPWRAPGVARTICRLRQSAANARRGAD